MEAYNILDHIPEHGEYILARITDVDSLFSTYHVMFSGGDTDVESLQEWSYNGMLVEWKPLTFAQYRTPIFNRTAYKSLWDSV